MTEQEFLAEIARRQRTQRMASGGVLFRRFAEGGDSGDPSGGWNAGNGDAVFGFAQKAIDPLGIFKPTSQNEFQAIAPGSAGWTGDQTRTGDMYSQQMAAQQQGQEIYGQQGQLASQLRDQAAGRGPSLAAMQNQQATQQNIAAAQSMAASQRGVNPALAARMAGDQASRANQQAAGQSAMARLAEQRGAQEQLAGLYGQQQQAALARQGMWGQQYGQQYGQNLQAQMGAQEINAQTAAGNTAANRSLVGSILGGVGAGSMAHGGVVRAADGIDVSLDSPAIESTSGFGGGIDPYAQPLEGGAAAAPSYGPENFGPDAIPAGESQDSSAPESVQPDESIKAPQEMVEDAASGANKPAASGSNKWLPMLIKYLLSAVMLKNAQRKFTPRPFDDGGEVGRPMMSSVGREKYFLDDPSEIARRTANERAKTETAAQLEEKNARDFAPSQALPPPSMPDTAVAKRAYGGEMEKQNDAGQNVALKAISSAGPIGAIIGSVLGMAQAHQDGQFARGGAVPVLVSGGEAVLSPQAGHDPQKAKHVVAELTRHGRDNEGMRVPGKAPHAGDDPRNDTVPMVLRGGQVVLPRSVMQSNDPPEAAAGFIKGLLTAEKQESEERSPLKRAMGGKVKPSYERLLKRQTELAKQIAALGSQLESAKG